MTIIVIVHTQAGWEGGEACVSLNNYDGNAPIFLWNDFGPAVLAPVNATYVQVLARPLGATSAFMPAIGAGDRTFFNLEIPGFFDGGVSRFINGVSPDSMAEFIVQAWRGAATWEEAAGNSSAFMGQSAVFYDKTGMYYPSLELPRPGSLSHMPSFTIMPVPEPSVVLMIILGSLVIGIQRRYG